VTDTGYATAEWYRFSPYKFDVSTFPTDEPNIYPNTCYIICVMLEDIGILWIAQSSLTCHTIIDVLLIQDTPVEDGVVFWDYIRYSLETFHALY
jgi:hypothetical protein